MALSNPIPPVPAIPFAPELASNISQRGTRMCHCSRYSRR